MKWMLIFFLVIFSLTTYSQEHSWGVIAFSDIHLHSKANSEKSYIPSKFKNLIKKLPSYIKKNNVKFIFLLGDTTSGNETDTFTLSETKRWWKAIYDEFSPIKKLGVHIIPIAGNHDFYTKNHQEAYLYGRDLFLKDLPKEIKLSQNPLYFTLEYENVDFFFLHLVTYQIEKEQKIWLENETRRLKDNGNQKIAFGHVALYSRLMKKPFIRFGDSIKNILESGNIHHYICGHEHYFWDEFIDGDLFRQTIMGTSSGTYNFSPHLDHFNKFCSGDLCEFTPGNLRVRIDPMSKKQIHSQMFLHFEFKQKLPYEMIPMAFKDEEIIPFGNNPSNFP